jgi:hypothetical protein
MTRTALITGASAGIGREFARELARQGFDLVLVARRRERLEALATQLAAELGVRCHVLVADLAESATPERIFDELKRSAIDVDMLINNAGSGVAHTFRRTPWSVHAH